MEALIVYEVSATPCRRSCDSSAKSACRDAGFSPNVRFEAQGAESLLGFITAGVGVSVVPESYSNLGRLGVAFRPLTGPAPTSTLQVARRHGKAAPVLRRFLTVIDEQVASRVDG